MQALCYCPFPLSPCPSASSTALSTTLTEMQTSRQYPNHYRSNSAGHKTPGAGHPHSSVGGAARSPAEAGKTTCPTADTTGACRAQGGSPSLCSQMRDHGEREGEEAFPASRENVSCLGPGPPATSWALLIATQPDHGRPAILKTPKRPSEKELRNMRPVCVHVLDALTSLSSKPPELS